MTGKQRKVKAAKKALKRARRAWRGRRSERNWSVSGNPYTLPCGVSVRAPDGRRVTTSGERSGTRGAVEAIRAALAAPEEGKP